MEEKRNKNNFYTFDFYHTNKIQTNKYEVDGKGNQFWSGNKKTI